ncbi:MAG: division/cell wall cluster transcriptional repressor MraZ [Alicyclobacillaceae bacterium]|jgi:MraZ protein|uniref:division/cell wall cluster transcriptional repressor MraZ n=1 Tax=Alicyclobacillus sp. SP_1 TaxID=2942475 RepID=UPI002158892E|nr:division/cell wall cluster transcriptional repressor MraZ [Alicyclobacillus sp. SP_1]MCY0886980.1 division/cell wall cluster transcriptional repressor MraZ [Alicyclobacillaceae bacterium]MCY0897184.1 division/cell wall cluster transcriptional repressor MraZ [Alicyclobacillaceae bacterium]
MFMGEFQHALDDKGRLTMPGKFRDHLNGTFVMTRGLDGCIFVYPAAEWETIERKLKSLPMTRADARSFVRMFFSGASECELDKQGRVLVPSVLREHAGLQKDCVVLGVSNRVEVWSQERWTPYANVAESQFAELAEQLTDLEF